MFVHGHHRHPHAAFTGHGLVRRDIGERGPFLDGAGADGGHVRAMSSPVVRGSERVFVTKASSSPARSGQGWGTAWSLC